MKRDDLKIKKYYYLYIIIIINNVIHMENVKLTNYTIQYSMISLLNKIKYHDIWIHTM